MSSDRVRLGSRVSLLTSQITPGLFPDEAFDYYSIPALDKHGGPIVALGSTIESTKFLLSRPAVLVSKLNPRKMRVQLFEGESENRAISSTEFMVFEPRNAGETSYRYLKHLLNGAEFARKLQAVATGTTNSHVRVRPTETLRWDVLLPPLEEQRRVAERLDTIDETIQSIERVIAKLRVARRGVVVDLLRPDSDWMQALVGDVLLRIESGKSPDTPDRRPGAGEWGVLKVSAVHPAGFRPNESKVLSADQVRAQDEVRPGDVLITRANTPEFVGLCCFVDSTPQRRQLSDKTLRLVPTPNVVPQFLALTLQSSRIRRQIERDGTGSSGSMKNISQAEIRALQSSWPSVERQISITETVQALDSRLAEEAAVLSKLQSTRSGLAADLLSGRVRTVAA